MIAEDKNMQGTISIECDHCNKETLVELGDLDFETFPDGDHCEYYASFTVDCAHCKRTLDGEYRTISYLETFHELTDCTSSGGTVTPCFDESETFFFNFGDPISVDQLKKSVAQIILEAEHNRSLIESIDPREFEMFVADIFRKNGFSVELTKQTRDGGKDVVAVKSTMGMQSKYLIECKRHKESNKVSVDVVRSLFGVQSEQGATNSVVVTTSSFTRDAIQFTTNPQTEWKMTLFDYDDLLSWVKSSNLF
jgi:HJR/Mrr/RecB family endonuclease